MIKNKKKAAQPQTHMLTVYFQQSVLKSQQGIHTLIKQEKYRKTDKLVGKYKIQHRPQYFDTEYDKKRSIFL